VAILHRAGCLHKAAVILRVNRSEEVS